MTDFAKFTEEFGGEESARETEALENRKEGEYEEVPHGVYEVKVTKCELTVGKTSGKLMATTWFKIVSGAHKNGILFRYQVIEKPFGRKMENEFLRSLGSGIEVKFNGNFDDYNKLHLDILADIDNKYEYQLNYAEQEGNPQYSNFTIENVFPL